MPRDLMTQDFDKVQGTDFYAYEQAGLYCLAFEGADISIEAQNGSCFDAPRWVEVDHITIAQVLEQTIAAIEAMRRKDLDMVQGCLEEAAAWLADL